MFKKVPMSDNHHMPRLVHSSLEALRSEAEQLKADVERLEDDLRPHIGIILRTQICAS